MQGNRIGRRTVLRTAGAVAAATAVAGCGTATGSRSSGGSKKRIVVSNSGGAYNDALTEAIYEPFTKETGITVSTVNYQSAQVIAQVKQGRPQVRSPCRRHPKQFALRLFVSSWCPTCPSVPVLMVIDSSQAHLAHVSTLSGPGSARIRQVVRGDQRRC